MDTRSYGLLFGFPLGTDHVGMNPQLLLEQYSFWPAIESPVFVDEINGKHMFISPLVLGEISIRNQFI